MTYVFDCLSQIADKAMETKSPRLEKIALWISDIAIKEADESSLKAKPQWKISWANYQKTGLLWHNMRYAELHNKQMYLGQVHHVLDHVDIPVFSRATENLIISLWEAIFEGDRIATRGGFERWTEIVKQYPDAGDRLVELGFTKTELDTIYGQVTCYELLNT